ncbi:TfoX/Sxy family protein [Glaciibacter sp. 2TAF33]|uniref:TfoX/Sxy family protein n=1 Tax=Glaciibacter sp. 2TAF33 TaxID=3233015 RepID=UPI003F9159CA
MSTSPDTVAFIEDQLAGLTVRTRPMFGEYGIYCDGKVVGLICGDALFLKPTDADPALFARTELAPPYPGAKEYHRVPGDALEDRDWLGQAVQATADALQAPKLKPLPKDTNEMKPYPRPPAR